jgi:dienelactone hydrolase
LPHLAAFALALMLAACVAATGPPPGSPEFHTRLYLPQGKGPFPAVVVLHGCNGVGAHERIWARQLVAWGYAALIVESFRARNVAGVCNHGRLVPPELQAEDGFDAANRLRSRPDIAASRIGVIGFSHGGWAVLKAVLAGGVARPANTPPFAVAVAFYPGCDPPRSPLESDTLILIGEADDWTSPARCRLWVDEVERNGYELRFKTYPGARHAFDAPSMPHYFAGHFIGRDPAAAADALIETRAFLDSRLAAAQ